METVHSVLMNAYHKLEFLGEALSAFGDAGDDVSPAAFYGASDVAREVVHEIRRITTPELGMDIHVPDETALDAVNDVA
jgi:hypothetical protein